MEILIGLLIIAGVAYFLLPKEKPPKQFSCPYCEPTVWFYSEAERDAHVAEIHGFLPPPPPGPPPPTPPPDIPPDVIPSPPVPPLPPEPPYVPPVDTCATLAPLSSFRGSFDTYTAYMAAVRIKNISSQPAKFTIGGMNLNYRQPQLINNCLAPGATVTGHVTFGSNIRCTVEMNGVLWMDAPYVFQSGGFFKREFTVHNIFG